MRFCSLGSGSGGNATVVEGGRGPTARRLLIDAGYSLRELESRLARAGLRPTDLHAIFVTHEHGDHIGCATLLAQRYGLPLWMSRGTWRAVGSPDLPSVLHFARDPAHWDAMLREMWRVLKRGGVFFARLATDIGHESRVRPLGNRRYIMPDGDERFLVDEAFIVDATARAGGTLLDPLKTSVVQDRRSMMTWVVRRDD